MQVTHVHFEGLESHVRIDTIIRCIVVSPAFSSGRKCIPSMHTNHYYYYCYYYQYYQYQQQQQQQQYHSCHYYHYYHYYHQQEHVFRAVPRWRSLAAPSQRGGTLYTTTAMFYVIALCYIIYFTLGIPAQPSIVFFQFVKVQKCIKNKQIRFSDIIY